MAQKKRERVISALQITVGDTPLLRFTNQDE